MSTSRRYVCTYATRDKQKSVRIAGNKKFFSSFRARKVYLFFPRSPVKNMSTFWSTCFSFQLALATRVCEWVARKGDVKSCQKRNKKWKKSEQLDFYVTCLHSCVYILWKCIFENILQNDKWYFRSAERQKDLRSMRADTTAYIGGIKFNVLRIC